MALASHLESGGIDTIIGLETPINVSWKDANPRALENVTGVAIRETDGRPGSYIDAEREIIDPQLFNVSHKVFEVTVPASMLRVQTSYRQGEFYLFGVMRVEEFREGLVRVRPYWPIDDYPHDDSPNNIPTLEEALSNHNNIVQLLLSKLHQRNPIILYEGPTLKEDY